jgi:hypothetical protein
VAVKRLEVNRWILSDEVSLRAAGRKQIAEASGKGKGARFRLSLPQLASKQANSNQLHQSYIIEALFFWVFITNKLSSILLSSSNLTKVPQNLGVEEFIGFALVAQT